MIQIVNDEVLRTSFTVIMQYHTTFPYPSSPITFSWNILKILFYPTPIPKQSSQLLPFSAYCPFHLLLFSLRTDHYSFWC